MNNVERILKDITVFVLFFLFIAECSNKNTKVIKFDPNKNVAHIYKIVVHNKEEKASIYFYKTNLLKIKIEEKNKNLIIKGFFKNVTIDMIGFAIKNQHIFDLIFYFRFSKMKRNTLLIGESKRYFLKKNKKNIYLVEIINFKKTKKSNMMQIVNIYNITKHRLEEMAAKFITSDKKEIRKYINYKEHPEILKKHDDSNGIYYIYKFFQKKIPDVNFVDLREGKITQNLIELLDFYLFVSANLKNKGSME